MLNPVLYLEHRKSFTLQLGIINLESHNPWASLVGLIVLFLWMSVVVEVNKVLISLDDGLSWIWIVVDGRVGHDLTEIGVLDLITDFIDRHLVLSELWEHEDLQRGRLHRGGYVDDLPQSRDTDCHVLVGFSSQVEGIESHLSGRFTNRLSTDGANHLAWVDKGVPEALPDLTDQHIKAVLVEPVLLNDVLRRKELPQVDLNQS